MKKILKLMGILSLALVVFSCSKKDDPSDNDLFVGTYKGSISFTDKDGNNKSADDGAVTVVKTGNTYYFRFSDGIENLTGVNFKKEGDSGLINIDLNENGVELKVIRISASKLYIDYTKDGKKWTANTNR